ncbi:MAG: discoidin domain-containing protein [Polyangiales bacterium]
MAPRVFDAALNEVREYFSLRASEERARELDVETREKLASDVRLSAQKRMAGEALFRQGQRAEALRLAGDAYTLVNAHRDLASERAKPRTEPNVAEIPLFDDDVRDEHVVLFDALVSAQVHLQSELAAIALDPHERSERRLARRVAAAALLLVIVIVPLWWARRTVLTAEATAQSGDRWGPANAVDGVEATHWVLPDKVLGHLDVKISPPQKLTSISVMNGWDPPGYATNQYRLEAFNGTTLLKSQDGALAQQPGGGMKPSWTTIPFVVDAKADRVRIVVKSYYDHAGAIAEVKIP